MESRLMKQGDEIVIHRQHNFYNAASMVSIKAVSVSFPEKNSGAKYEFHVYYYMNGTYVSFPLLLEPPYYFSAGRFNPSSNMRNPYEGPFNMIKIEYKSPTPLAIQVSFTDKLA